MGRKIKFDDHKEVKKNDCSVNHDCRLMETSVCIVTDNPSPKVPELFLLVLSVRRFSVMDLCADV